MPCVPRMRTQSVCVPCPKRGCPGFHPASLVLDSSLISSILPFISCKGRAVRSSAWVPLLLSSEFCIHTVSAATRPFFGAIDPPGRVRASCIRAGPLGLVEGLKAVRFYIGLSKCFIIKKQFFESRFRFLNIILDALIFHHCVWVLCFGLQDSFVVAHRLTCGNLVLRPGTEPMLPALKSGFSTTGPPGKSQGLLQRRTFSSSSPSSFSSFLTERSFL